jgi:2-C-methyl-D-erythritol 4-phosphate cytidylyltransferase/2-C-methyl-D-erythritol 2,4-cyclodiphosphate synthase
MDALLGAAALGDIGQLFPDKDPQYAGADSIKLLQAVMQRLHEAGYAPINVDATVLAQAPKLAPYRPAMQQRLAETMGLPTDCVSVKATTEEHLGPTGEGLAISAHAVCLLQKL